MRSFRPNPILPVIPNIPQEEKTVPAPVESSPIITPSVVTPLNSGIIGITGAAIGAAYQQRPLTMAALTMFILLIIGLFVYTHAKQLLHWPFHFKSTNKKWLVITLIILLGLVLLFIHLILLTYFRTIYSK